MFLYETGELFDLTNLIFISLSPSVLNPIPSIQQKRRDYMAGDYCEISCVYCMLCVSTASA